MQTLPHGRGVYLSQGPLHAHKATVYNNIAFVYSAKGDYNKAIEYFQKAIELGERVGDYAISMGN